MKAAGRVVGVTCALLSAVPTWQLVGRLIASPSGFHPLPQALLAIQIPMALVAIWATFHRKSHEFLPFVAAIAFFGGFGWYLIMNPPPVRWIGIGNLGYVVAWILLREPPRVTGGHGTV